MKVLIFNQHPDCSLYVWKAMTDLGFNVEFATEDLTLNLGFPYSATKKNRFEVVNKSFSPEEFSETFSNVRFVNEANHDLYLSISPKVFDIFKEKCLWDVRMQFFMKHLGHLPCRKVCNHPSAEKYGFKFCSNWVPPQKNSDVDPFLITQLIIECNLVSETVELIKLRRRNFPVVIAGGRNSRDGFVRDRDVLPYTSLLVHNKQFGINCYAVCKALDLGILVYMSRFTKESIGFGDLPDDLFLFKEDYSIEQAYKISLSSDRKKKQEIYRSIYTLERTKKTLMDCLR